ncbi:uncharacterized protein LOC142160397 [Mixophyes fleayi]|uniref:uncharacterized protein LOC142160397 n=1 Tax=Mixophyes fleayi TaxID=3061075 RepID=UPI003F4D9EB5
MKCLIVLWVFIMLTDSLEVKTYKLQTPALVQRDILLRCDFISLEPVRLQDIAVKWIIKRSGVVNPVYMFDGITTNSQRSGSHVDLRFLEMGNASLYLSDLTLEDEGEYTCTVIISPDAGKSTLLLKVAAQPTINLAPVNPNLTGGETKTFFCELSHFYPQDVEIIWFMKKQEMEIVITSNICTGIPILGENGTFSVSSQVSMIFSEEDNGVVLICEVRHNSLLQPLRRNTTLHLAILQILQGDVGFIATVVVSTIALLLLACIIFTILYQKLLAKVSPLVSPLILPELNADDEKMVAFCNISGFRPKAIDIHWYIDQSKGEPGTDHSVNGPLLQPADITSQAHHPVTKHGTVFNVTSQLSYTPCVLDNGAMLVCEVQHKALQRKTRHVSHINVAARPKKTYITSWPQIPRIGETLILSCIVEKFYPKLITITWLKNGQSLTNVTQFGPFPCENIYYSVWSQTDFLLTADDDGVIFTCQISHSSLGKIEELSYEINLKGTPPEVQFISADPPTPHIGEEMCLSCKISNFCPMDIKVNWFKNGIQLEAGVYNSVCVTSNSGVQSMCSILKFTPRNEDNGSVFTCNVQHIALKNCEERSYTLKIPLITSIHLADKI